MTDKPQLLIVDDDELIQDVLGGFFSSEFDVIVAHHLNEVKSALTQLSSPPDFALVDLGLPPSPHQPTEGFAVISMLQAAAPDCAIVVVSGQDARRHGQRARALGAADYAEKPCAPKVLQEKLLQVKKTILSNKRLMGLIGESAPITMLREQIRLIAPVSFPVLIRGESGVGKEVVARALHDSTRARRPFLAINCAAIPEHLVEPTLFGYAKGAFTGASIANAGYLGDAADGTLFLDEIGDLPEVVQPKLLRVLETGEYHRVGETKPKRCVARIVAASNHLQHHATTASGYIRDDLYYRLSVFTINVPPLRQMVADRFLLLNYFRSAIAKDLSADSFDLTTAAKTLWEKYHFPGNVRELKNIVARLQVKYAGQTVDADALKTEMCIDDAGLSGQQLVESGRPLGNGQPTINAIAIRLGISYAKDVLARHGGHVVAAAAQLQINEKELQFLLNQTNWDT